MQNILLDVAKMHKEARCHLPLSNAAFGNCTPMFKKHLVKMEKVAFDKNIQPLASSVEWDCTYPLICMCLVKLLNVKVFQIQIQLLFTQFTCSYGFQT